MFCGILHYIVNLLPPEYCAVRVVLFSEVSICVCLFVDTIFGLRFGHWLWLTLCTLNIYLLTYLLNTWILRDIIAKFIAEFSGHHPMVERVDKFENGYIGMCRWFNVTDIRVSVESVCFSCLSTLSWTIRDIWKFLGIILWSKGQKFENRGCTYGDVMSLMF